MRQVKSQHDRSNEDLVMRIQEALDKQSDRMMNEKALDMEAINQRND